VANSIAMTKLLRSGLVAACTLAACTLFAQPTFIRLENLPFYDDEGYLRGISWIDVDGDHDLDVCISGAIGNPAVNATGIYLNLGQDQFQASNLISSNQNNPFGHAWADIENDGDLDLYIGATWNQGGINELWVNNNGSFQLTQTTGATPNTALPYEGSVSWADFDNDGWIDLYLARWNDAPNTFYKNNGNGTFTPVTNGAIATDAAWTSAAIWGDYNRDGFPDLYVVNYQIGSNPGANILYRNNGNGSFTVVSGAGPIISDELNSRTANWIDANNDGWLDVFVANQNAPDKLYLNNNDGTFSSQDIGDDHTSWSSNWGDLDNDGDLDLITIGFWADDSRYYENNGDGTFTDQTQSIPAIFPLETNGSSSNGLVFVDYNSDGLLDLHICQPATSPDHLFKNTSENCNTWLELELKGIASNQAAIGSIVRAKATINGNPAWQTRQISSQTSKPGTNPLRAHIGFGDADLIDSLIIEWPAGGQCVFTDVQTRQLLIIEEDCFIQKVITPNAEDIFLCLPEPDTLLVHPSGESGTWSASCGDCMDDSGLLSSNDLAPGNYELYFSYENNCGAHTDTIALQIANANAGADSSLSICPDALPVDLNMLLSGNPTLDGDWLNGNFQPTESIQTDLMDSDVFYYTVQDGMCADTAQITFNLLASPTLLLSPDTSVIQGSEVELMASGGNSYTWEPATNLSCSDCSTPVFTAQDSTTFIVTAISADGCSSIDSVTVSVSPGGYKIPNAFTPDGDGINDTFGFILGGDVQVIEFNIYNRWGELVHEDIQAWDGKTNGNPAPSDVYIYTAVIKNQDGTEEMLKGDVTLIR
jgi:gliding motility-associated-like protein